MNVKPYMLYLLKWSFSKLPGYKLSALSTTNKPLGSPFKVEVIKRLSERAQYTILMSLRFNREGL